MLSAIVKFGLSIWGFSVKHWKIIVPVLGALALIFLAVNFHQKKVTEFGNKRFAEGVSATLDKAREQIQLNNKLNRKREQDLAKALEDYAAEVNRKDKARVAREERITKKAETMIDNDPRMNADQCSISPELMRERNNIRSLMEF